MTEKIYAYVGNWGFAPAPKGISIFQFNQETGAMALIETIRYDIAAGQLCLDAKNRILYAVNECGERRGGIGGGGYLLAFRINPETGGLTLINEKESLLPEPSYLCLDKSGKYLLTCHCADPWHVTKIKKNEDGTFQNEVLFDDTAIVMFRIREDGGIGDVCDVAITPGTGGNGPNSRKNVDPVTNHIQLVQVISRLHAVVQSPGGGMFVACDKGMDKLIAFKLDRNQEKIVITDEYVTEEVACFPRYGTFHPTLPVFYANNENLAQLNCFHYDEDAGKLELFCKVKLLSEEVGLIEGKPVGAQDILIHPDGRTLYVTLCGLNQIVVLSVGEDGIPAVKQNIPSGGNLPRGINISPDGRFLVSGNMVSGDITTFFIHENGMLESTGKLYKAVSPSAIQFFRAGMDDAAAQ
ncbi:hypothetical protein DXC92_07485 [Clostridiales bacterium TF09-2AC]|nr:hypothetical protein DXC92_07485 [Clostridiales bacterium TF09-2AC]